MNVKGMSVGERIRRRRQAVGKNPGENGQQKRKSGKCHPDLSEKETSLPSTIPARKAMANHISGSRVVNKSGMRLVGVVSAACISAFHHSIELYV